VSDPARPVLAILGGTGDQGRGLALRWSAAGYPVVIGSRAVARAEATARDAAARVGHVPGAGLARGADNHTAAQTGDVVVLSVPYAAMAETARSVADAVAGKVAVSVVVPLVPPRVSVVQLPAAGSAAAELQALWPQARVVAAFQNVAADLLMDLDAAVACDVLVAGDDGAAKATVLDLSAALGVTAFDAGPLANAGVVEGLTAVLIGINRRHKVSHAGIRIVGVPRPGQ
jgi:8-hydroxy-5-deazaflavin:NADPH oxidoreductase